MDQAADLFSEDPQAERTPPVLRTVVVCLTALAVLTAIGGTVAGFIVLSPGVAAGRDVGLVVMRAMGCFVGGFSGGAILWAVAWILRQQYQLAAAQRRIAAALGEPPWIPVVSPTKLEPLEAGAPPLPDSPQDAAPVAKLAAPAEGGTNPASETWPADSQILRRLLAEIEDIKADLLLTPEQREAKRRRLEQQRMESRVHRIETAIAAGEYTQAEQRLAEFAQHYPGTKALHSLRRRMADRLAEGADLALSRRNVTLAERLLDRLAEAYDAPDHVVGVRERLADHYAGEIEKLTQQNDLATADAMLERLCSRCADDVRCERLRKRLAAARDAVAEDEVQRERRRVEELMSVAAFDKAEAVADELLARHPGSREAARLRDLVSREAAAFRAEHRGRLVAEVERYAESRQWRHAVEAAKRLLEAHPDSAEARDVLTMMATLEENAKIEEVREMRDTIQDRIRRRRFEEAAELAREVIRRFPETQAAIQLRQQLPRLLERMASGEGHRL